MVNFTTIIRLASTLYGLPVCVEDVHPWLGRQIEHAIKRWYRGMVRFIVDLQPHTVIKDEMIPALLRQQNQPTFVTMNESDFWQKVVAAY